MITEVLITKLPKHSSLKKIKELLIGKVAVLYKKSNISVPLNDDFDTGIWFVSDYIYERLMTGAFNNYKKSGFLFFDPMKFANSILNSFTLKLAESLKIRGYSNSYIISDFNNILVEFSSYHVSNGIVVNIYKETREVILEIVILKK